MRTKTRKAAGLVVTAAVLICLLILVVFPIVERIVKAIAAVMEFDK